MDESDKITVLNWCNSDRARRYMYNDKIITRDEHDFWFDKAKNGPNIDEFIYGKTKNPLDWPQFTENML